MLDWVLSVVGCEPTAAGPAAIAEYEEIKSSREPWKCDPGICLSWSRSKRHSARSWVSAPLSRTICIPIPGNEFQSGGIDVDHDVLSSVACA